MMQTASNGHTSGQRGRAKRAQNFAKRAQNHAKGRKKKKKKCTTVMCVMSTFWYCCGYALSVDTDWVLQRSGSNLSCRVCLIHE